MADSDANAVLTDTEQGDEADQGIQNAPPTGMQTNYAPGSIPSGSSAPPASQVSPAPQTPQQQPQISGRALFLGNLLRTLMTSVQNAPGNPNNAFARGFMNASPQAQQQRANQQAMAQAQISKANSDADTAKLNTAITGMKALQLEYLIKRLPQQEQQQHLDAISSFKNNLIKEGADVVAEGDDERASDSQATKLNSTDQRATSHAGKFYSLPTMNSDGSAKWDVVYVPGKDVLQEDYHYKDGEGNDQVIAKGTPMYGAMGKFVDSMQQSAQAQTKADHKQLSDFLTGKIPDSDVNQAVATWENRLKQNDPLVQQNKQAIVDRISALKTAHAQDFGEAIAKQKAGAEARTAGGLTGKDVLAHTDQGDVLMSGKEAKDQGVDDYSTLNATMAQKIKDQRANADASMDAFNDYRQTFNASADKLTSQDRDALRVLTSHLDSEARSGILGGVIDELPLVGPMSGYANKLLSGTMTSDQYKQLSPAGKQLYAKYGMSIVANFANMKQMLGTVGRNPAMIQAEMSQIPLPYIDKESANTQFDTKISDVKKRNQSIPKVYQKQQTVQ